MGIGTSIAEWQRIVYVVAEDNGFHDGPPDVWKLLGNLMAEAAETWEEARRPDFEPSKTYYGKDGKPEGLPSELADVVIRALGTAEALGTDLQKAIEEKVAFNRTRPYRHGGRKV